MLEKARFGNKHASILFNSHQKLMPNKLLDWFEGKLTSSNWTKITKTSLDTAGRDIIDWLDK